MKWVYKVEKTYDDNWSVFRFNKYNMGWHIATYDNAETANKIAEYLQAAESDQVG